MVVGFGLDDQLHDSQGSHCFFIEGVTSHLPFVDAVETSLKRTLTPEPLLTRTRLTMAFEIWTLMIRASLCGEWTSSKSLSEYMIKMLESMVSGLLMLATSLGFLQVSFLSFLVFRKYSCSLYMQLIPLGDWARRRPREPPRLPMMFFFWKRTQECFSRRQIDHLCSLSSHLFKVLDWFLKIFDTCPYISKLSGFFS